VNGAVFAMGLQSQGKVVIGGSFTSVNNTNRNRIARLNSDGSMDLGFNPGAGANNIVYALSVLPDDNIIIAGDFTSVDGLVRNRIARLEANDTGLKILNIALISGHAQLTLSTRSGINYVLQGSPDLSSWTDVTTNIAVGSSLIMTDPNAASFNRQFYRVRQGP